MAIDIATERTLPISKVPENLPNRPHVATVWRWVYHGCKGIKLETVTIGGRRLTSQEALERFIERTSAAADGNRIPQRSRKQRERALAAAERELQLMGI